MEIKPPIYEGEPKLAGGGVIKYCPFCGGILNSHVSVYPPFQEETDRECTRCRILFQHSIRNNSIDMLDLDSAVAAEQDELQADKDFGIIQ